jgi:adenylate cyclase, class 2
MHITNFEFKASVNDLKELELKLQSLNPKFIGTDHQIDTYFNAPSGRLKLREGNIENALISYDREDSADSKKSEIILYRHQPDKALKAILTLQLGIKAIVDKTRKIYFIDNVKFHFDSVKGLGTFIEVEAIDEQNKYSIQELKDQCDSYLNFFGLIKSNLISKSYCDLIIETKIHGNTSER